MTEDEPQSNEREALECGHDAGGERNDVAAATEDVADRLFLALDVNNAGEVDLCELASGVSVRLIAYIDCTHGRLKWVLQSCFGSGQSSARVLLLFLMAFCCDPSGAVRRDAGREDESDFRPVRQG